MKKLSWLFFLTILLFACPICFAQTYEDPPPMAMPTKENKLLIDKIIEVTDYKSYFNNYCLNYISRISKKEKWTKERLEKANGSVSFWSFDQTIYNRLAGYSNSQLYEYLEKYKKDKKSYRKNLLVESAEIEKALESRAIQIITESQK